MAAQEYGRPNDAVTSSAVFPGWVTPFRPLVDVVARIPASVHIKLLCGFLVGVLLILGMAILSLLVVDRMSQRVEELGHLQDNMDRAQRMQYLITAQSHFRAMALLTSRDEYKSSIDGAEEEFLTLLEQSEAAAPPERRQLFQNVREANRRFTVFSDAVLELYETQGTGLTVDQARELAVADALSREVEAAFVEIEDAARQLQADASVQMQEARARFDADRRLITTTVWTFIGVSLTVALLGTIATSWAFVRPVRATNNLLARVAQGDFSSRISVPNRDEFGTLSHNLNRMSEELASLYQQLSSLNETLRQRLVELEEAHRQLQSYTIQAEELAAVQERNRLARELHDSVTQTIFSMTLTAEAVRLLVDRDPAQAAAHLERLQELAQEALSEMRTLIQQLRPASLAGQGLVVALQKHLDSLKSRGVLDVDFRVEGEGQLSQEKEEGLFRVAQEALNNVVKHARTGRAVITLKIKGGGAALLIEDQGVGFEPGGGPGNGGFGLTSMRERAEMAGGSLEVQSSPGKGTRVLLEIPEGNGSESDGQS